MYTHLIESILPLDYYSFMTGVLIDQRVFLDIFESKFRKMSAHLRALDMDLSVIIF